ncbi:MAG: hypothetical protein ACI4KJ_05450 [Anaerovoracaceae bacterium]
MAAGKKKTTDSYRAKEERRSKGARVMAIIMIFLMLAFTFLTAGIFLMD